MRNLSLNQINELAEKTMEKFNFQKPFAVSIQTEYKNTTFEEFKDARTSIMIYQKERDKNQSLLKHIIYCETEKEFLKELEKSIKRNAELCF